MKFNSFLVVLTSLFFMGCTDRGLINLQSGNLLAKKNWASEQSSFEIPFVWHDGHIIIEANINGQKGIRLAFDSGAAATVLFDSERTQRLNLSGSSQISLHGHKIDVINDVELQLEYIQFSGLTVLHVPIDQSPIFDDIEQAYFDGAIGYDLLSEYVIKIDYSQNKLRFYKEGFNWTEEQGWQVLTLDVSGRIPYISVSLGDTPESASEYQFVIDTGAPDYLYLNSELTENYTFPAEYYETLLSNFEGEHVLKTGKIPHVSLAGFHFPELVSHDMSHFQDPIGVGLIGSRLLRTFEVMFDYSKSIVALKPNDLSTNLSLADRSGLQIEPHKQGGIVRRVSPSSHAFEKGIREGNLVTSINGVEIVPDNFDRLRELLSSNKKVLEVCFIDKTNQTCTDINLADRI
ncbi:MAG: hypothetical protein QNJ78_07025 [Gammaproteobacteria bacterium]|nr:hypothetical protein [Gammaproteobacteria bacterium]